mgnify:CR=1 FL=1
MAFAFSFLALHLSSLAERPMSEQVGITQFHKEDNTINLWSWSKDLKKCGEYDLGQKTLKSVGKLIFMMFTWKKSHVNVERS